MAIYKEISTNLKHNGFFTPMIPPCRHKQQEDDVTPRICVAPTIEDCLTAIPNGGGHLDQLNVEQRGYYLLFTIDTEKLGISDEDIVSSETLYQKDLVRDSDVTNEVWIMKSFQVPPEDIQLIKVVEWNEQIHDILPYSIYEIADREYEGNYLDAYQDIYKENVPCSIGIESVQYMTETLEEGEEVTLYFGYDWEYDEVLGYIDEIEDVKIVEEYTDQVTIRAKKDVNFRGLFLYHAEMAELF